MQYQQPLISEARPLSAHLGAAVSAKPPSDAEIKHGVQPIDYEAPEISGQQELSGGLIVASGPLPE